MLDQFWGGLVSLASAPTAPLLAKELLVDDKNHDLIWNLSKGLYPMMGNPLPASGPRLDALRTKQSMYYGLATIQQMHLISPVVQALTEALPGNTDYLAQHADLAVTGLSAVPTSRFCRALYSDASGPGKQAVTDVLTSALTEPQLASSGVALVRAVGSDPNTSQAFTDFSNRWSAFTASKEYQALQLGDTGRDILNFFEDQSTDSRAAMTEKDLRSFVADQLQSGNLDQILVLIAHDPAKFQNLLDTFSDYVKNGDLKGFFAYLRRTLRPIH